MARTAPAPDIPPIPGMCPSIAVLAGGADAGGAGGKGARGGGGKTGAGGGKGGSNASGDGRGAPEPKKYPECGYASHPVDVATGRAFTHPIADLELPGPLPLTFERVYSSKMAHRDVGLGYGWGHTFGWEIEVHRHQITIWNEYGIGVDFPLIPEGAEVLGPWGWVLRRETWGFAVDAEDGLWRLFSASEQEGKRFRLTAIEDRNRNRISLTYENGCLVEVQDSARRIVRFRSTPERRISTIEVNNAVSQGKWTVFATYAYDANGDLTRATDAEGYSSTYEYDESHRLTLDLDRAGLAFHFCYDAEGRCVESWGNYPGRTDPSLGGKPLSRHLFDRVTTAKGIHHCKLDYGPDGYTEVADSTEVRRYFANAHGTLDKRVEGGGAITATYDDNGQLLSRTDAMGATTTYQRDHRGRLLTLVDALGRVTSIERDANGLMTRFTTPAGGVRSFVRNRFGDPEMETDEFDAVTSCRYDARGLMTELTDPHGDVTRFDYDSQGNLTSVAFANGGTHNYTYDALGRMLSETDPLGATTRNVYSTRGDLVATCNAAGAVTRFVYDGEQRIVQIVSPTGRTTTVEWGGYHKVCALRDANGHFTKVVYSADGQPLEVLNELGEVCRYNYTPMGMLVEETTFDGVRTEFRHNVSGLLVETTDALGRRTRLVRNPVGDVVERQLPDGSVETYEYDLLGNIVRATNGAIDVWLKRDGGGRVLCDTQSIGDRSHSVESEWEPGGERVGRRTSLGYVEQRRVDPRTGAESWLLGGDHEVRIETDLIGREITRHLPRGGKIQSTFDHEGRLAQKAVFGTRARRAVGPMEPAWIGQQDDGKTFAHAYRYNEEGELLEVRDQEGRSKRYERDPVGQLLSILPDWGRGELFRFDAAGNMHDASAGEQAHTTYGPGGRLLRQGHAEYRWNDLGQLVGKRVHSPADERDRDWLYDWNSAGQLARVESPTEVIEFAYDAFVRRVEKRVFGKTESSARLVPTSVTRFVWDGNLLAHEIKEIFAEAGDPVVEERTYCFEDGGFAPMAHSETRRVGGAAREHRWVYYVNGVAGEPLRLADADGEIVGELDMSAWGRVDAATPGGATTPIRFQGQYADGETGLCYNRFRYYDPETGRFISHDPLGLDGGLNLYRYVDDPTGWADPLGLAGRCTCTITTKKPVGGKKKFKGTSGATKPNHKSVQKALSKTKLPKGKKAPSHPKGACGEPAAITNYLNAWEAENGKINNNHAKLDKALDNIKSIEPVDNELEGKPTKKLCAYCRAFMPTLGGKKLLDKVKQEGAVD